MTENVVLRTCFCLFALVLTAACERSIANPKVLSVEPRHDLGRTFVDVEIDRRDYEDAQRSSEYLAISISTCKEPDDAGVLFPLESSNPVASNGDRVRLRFVITAFSGLQQQVSGKCAHLTSTGYGFRRFRSPVFGLAATSHTGRVGKGPR